MSMMQAAQEAAAQRLGGSAKWQDFAAPMTPSFGAIPTPDVVAQANAAAPAPAPKRTKLQEQFLEGVKSGLLDANGFIQSGSAMGERFYGPDARAFVTKHGGWDKVRGDKDLLVELDALATNELRGWQGLDPVQAEAAPPKAANKPLPFDQASKLSAIEASYNQIQDLADSLFDPQTGAFLRGDAAKAKLPGTKEARYALKGQQALETWLRAMTGAAVTESEMDRYTRMYLPQPWDDADVALDKLERLQALYIGTLENMGRGDKLDASKSRVSATKLRREAARKAAGAQTPEGTQAPSATAGRREGTPGFNRPQQPAADDSEWEDVR